jgi:hypothetical protein
MQTINITVHTEDASQIEAIKAVMKAFKIKYEIAKTKPYDPKFVAMIKKGEKEFAEGKGVKMSVAEFKELCK